MYSGRSLLKRGQKRIYSTPLLDRHPLVDEETRSWRASPTDPPALLNADRDAMREGSLRIPGRYRKFLPPRALEMIGVSSTRAILAGGAWNFKRLNYPY